MGNAQTFKTDKIGFQVTSVSPLSPGAEAGLVVLTDFILTMNGQSLPFMEVEKIMSTVKVISSQTLIAYYSHTACFCLEICQSTSYVNGVQY